MRYFLAIIGGLTMGLVANQAPGQVAGMGGIGMAGGMGVGSGMASTGGNASFGGMANPSVAGQNMNMGANMASLGGNANLGAVRSGMGGGYGGTAQASVVGSNMAGAGGYPMAAGGPRYFGQNNSTAVGMFGTGAAVANQPGQPFALNRFRSTFSGGVTSYNPGVRSTFGGPNNGQGYTGQRFDQGSGRGYNRPAYNQGFAGQPNMPAAGNTGLQAPYNGLPNFTYGRSFPAGYAPYRAYQSSSPINYQSGSPTNYPSASGAAPGWY